MKYSDAVWAEKRKRGILSFLFFDGVLTMGGPFAVLMQIVGYFFLRDEGQTFGEYFSSTRMWTTFFLHATLFGLIMGYLNWRRNERPVPGEIDLKNDKTDNA
jgi:uncharacterized membrane protein